MHAASGPSNRGPIGQWLAAFAVGGVGVLLLQTPASLVDPPRCPGLLELAAVLAARSFSTTPLASILTWANSLGTFLSLAALVRVIQRGGPEAEVKAGWAVPTAVGLAAAFALTTAPVLAPPAMLAIGVAACTMLAAAAAATLDDSHKKRSAVLAVLGLSLSAAIATSLTGPFAAVAAWLAWHVWRREPRSRRTLAVVIAGASVVLGALAVSAALPVLPSAIPPASTTAGCFVPWASPSSVSNININVNINIVDAARLAFITTGPLAVALALLGAFVSRRLLPSSTIWPVAAIAVLPLASVAWPGPDPARTLAPAVVGFWWLVAAGVREVVVALGGSVGQRLGAAAIVAALPVLQWTHRLPPQTLAADRPLGHEQLTRRTVARMLGVLPDRSVLVIDDAVTALLLGASTETVARGGKDLRFVPARADDIATLLPATRVFALPRAQQTLQHQGLQVSNRDQTLSLTSGLAAVEPGGACIPADSVWRSIVNPQKWASLALVSRRAAARGPLLLYLASTSPLDPHPLDWPSNATRGFSAAVYHTDSDRPRIEWLMKADGAPAEHPAFAAAYVTRLEFWRVPDAPFILPVALGGVVLAGAVVGRTPADAPDLRVCPSFPHKVSPLDGARFFPD